LSNAPHIADGTFDCIILTQTLHYVFDLKAAVATLYRILRPGGVVLATLPGISQICRDQDDKESDCWRFTAASARRIFGESFEDPHVRVETYGNVLAAAAFLYGLCAQDLSNKELDRRDRDYQLTITVTAVKRKEIV
jgi:SAM-dependent methyltransferase